LNFFSTLSNRRQRIINKLDIKGSNGNILRSNSAFSFAHKHALQHYSTNAIYSYIPKNACSSLRLSLAISNGIITDISQHEWIHNNNDVFQASLKELVLTPYKFVILRCPFERLLSVYLDKIVGRTTLAWSLENKLDRKVGVANLNFLEFARAVAMVPKMDHHWRAQSDFLIFDSYDDYFDIKDMSSIVARLKKRLNLDVYDSRDLYQHGLDQVKLSEESTNEACKVHPIELLYAKHKGSLPTKKSFFNDEIISMVRKVYAKDIALYSEKFGAGKLLF
jgi:hypothetical protein